jgi:deoxyribodipyrimidine photo-lyase
VHRRWTREGRDFVTLHVSQVLPLFCFDPRQFQATPWGHPKTGSVRAAFQLESVLALRRALQAIGSDLLIRKGHPEDIVPGE